MIAGQIARQVPMNAKHWQTSTEPATPTGQSLQGLYKIARKRFVDGRSFFGHGNWRDYLRSKHKLLIPDHSFGRRKKGYPDEEVHTMISEQLMKQVPTGSEHWRISTEPAAPTGQSLQALYYLARGRRVGGKSFFGYGNWYNYLEQRHRVGSLDTAYLPNARVHSMIARQIANGVSMTTEHWVKSNEPATEAGQSLNNLYQIVRRRRVHGKLFLGYGDWKTYLREAHKVTV
jgi:hypothetical protein